MTIREDPITGILLAAGAGSRFSPDGSSDKLLARLPDGVEVAVASLRLLLPVCNRVVAVVRPEALALSRRLSEEGAIVLPCVTAAQGMGSSLACAARSCLDHPTNSIVALADMPWIMPATVRQVAAMLGFNAVVAPVYQGRRGHPVGFAADMLQVLAHLSGDAGARSILQSDHVFRMECDDPGVVQDIDVPADLVERRNYIESSQILPHDRWLQPTLRDAARLDAHGHVAERSLLP